MTSFARLPAALAFGAALLALPGPALAQPAAEPKVNMVIVYGDDKCPESTGDEIVVCPRLNESERYRIPPSLRGSDSPQNEAWNNKVMAYETVGRGGIMSCSPVGPGGSTGCTAQLINAAYAEKKNNPDLKMSQLIAAERAKRLSTIDEDAAETQARVEQAEKDYIAREQAAQQGQPIAQEPPLPAPQRP
jgi:hypothetical protein